jgi:hypothetical protein
MKCVDLTRYMFINKSDPIGLTGYLCSKEELEDAEKVILCTKELAHL